MGYNNHKSSITKKGQNKMAILKSGRHTFETVNELPAGYIVWNIGRHNFQFEGYIPLCQNTEGYNVNTETLKALKVKSEGNQIKFISRRIKTTIKERR